MSKGCVALVLFWSKRMEGEATQQAKKKHIGRQSGSSCGISHERAWQMWLASAVGSASFLAKHRHRDAGGIYTKYTSVYVCIATTEDRGALRVTARETRRMCRLEQGGAGDPMSTAAGCRAPPMRTVCVCTYSR